MLPGPSVVGPEMQPLALMAEGDDGEEVPPWRSGGASSSRDRSRSATTRITTGTMDVPGVQGFTREERGIPNRGRHPLEAAPSTPPMPPPGHGDTTAMTATATPVVMEDDAEEEVDTEDAEAEIHGEGEEEDVVLDQELEEEDLGRHTATEPEGETYDRGDFSPDSPEEDDYWTMGGQHLIRHHVRKRRTPFHPVGSRLDMPVSRDRLLPERHTNKVYEDGHRVSNTDNWQAACHSDNARTVTLTYHRVRRYPATPVGYSIVRRIAIDQDTDTMLCDDEEAVVSDFDQCTRSLGKVRNLRVVWFYIDDVAEDKPWKGTTVFKLKDLDEELKVKRCQWDQEDPKKTLPRGKKKQLSKEVEKMENEDLVMWSNLLHVRPSPPRGWKLLFEIFCGCALLTRMAQAGGYETCEPVDIKNGWDVFRLDHRKYVESVVDREQPYLLAIGFPCGPWSPWQRMNQDKEHVNWQRQKWLPILKWLQQLVLKHRRRGGKTLLENPWMSEAWNTKELKKINYDNIGDEDDYEVLRVDLCQFGLKDKENGMPHLKPTAVGTDSPGIKKKMRNKRCHRDHDHQALEGSNRFGRRTLQAAQWTTRFCKTILEGIYEDLRGLGRVAFSAEDAFEDLEEDPDPMDGVHGPEDLPYSRVGQGDELEKEVELHEGMDNIERDTDPHGEKVRRQEWLKLSKDERVGVRRLHHMTSHASRPQLQRMLRYAGAPPRVVKGVQHFRCGICERDSEEKKPFPMKTPSPYTFNETIGIDVFEVKDAGGTRFQILHAICHGTTYQCGEVLGEAQGVPSSARCLQAFLRFWSCWAGTPQYILADRGLHNRGVFQSELEKAGAKFRTVATEAPWELGRVERHGGILKHMMNKVIMAEQVTGKDELRMALVEALNTKNRLGNLGGFSPQQWVLGHHPKMEGWPDEEIAETYVLDEDAMSAFNRRAAFREASRLSWMQEDSQKRIRKGILRQGGSEHGIYRTGDMVSFQRKRGGKPRWFGPARVLVQEGRNLWILHGGVPIVIADTMVRPSCPEELLEHELLGKRTKGVKRFRGFGYEDVAQPHQFGSAQQQSYMDFRRDDVEKDLLEEFRPGTAAPTEVGGDDESPKRRRQIETELLPEEVPVPVSPTPTTPLGEEGDDTAGGESSPVTSPPVTELQRAMRMNLNQLDVGASRATRMRNMDDSLDIILPNIPGEEPRDRSRSPHGGRGEEPQERVVNHAVRHEFNCFLAKRTSAKAKAKSRGAQEIVYRHETEEMRQKLDEARGKEWSNWLKYGATREPSAEEVDRLLRQGYKAIPMRWVDIDKNDKLRVPGGPQVDLKLKSRLVMRGDLEPGDFRVDCPTSSQVGVHLVISYATCEGLRLRAGDITSAFLQGAPIDRVLLMKVPSDGIPNVNGQGNAYDPGSYLIALMSIYGSRDAPRGFWMALRGELLAQGLCEIEPAMYSLSIDGRLHGLATTHVDDILWCGTEAMDNVMAQVQARFTFGSVEELGEGAAGSFRYCGRRIEDHGKYVSITTPEILKKVKPIQVEQGRKRPPNEPATADEQSQMRAVLGSLGWVARLCRPELSYRCSALQGRQSKPTVADLNDANKLLSAAQKTSQFGIHFMKGKINFETACLLSVTDASHAAEVHVSEVGKPQGHRSQAGRFLLLADRMPDEKVACNVQILEWCSHALRRVCRSTLQAETLSSMDGSESGNYVRGLMHSMVHPKTSNENRLTEWKINAMDSRHLHWVSDCRSFISYMGNPNQNTVTDKRLAIDLTALRQELWRKHGTELGEPGIQSSVPEDGSDHLWWVSTKDMLSDGLTKQMVWHYIRNLCEFGTWKLTMPPLLAGTPMANESTQDF